MSSHSIGEGMTLILAKSVKLGNEKVIHYKGRVYVPYDLGETLESVSKVILASTDELARLRKMIDKRIR